MQISQTIEYALRAVLWLAEHRGQTQTTQTIADACHAPPSYLAKVLQSLVRSGIVSAQRGPGGGFSLERDPEELSLLSVIHAVEPAHKPASCPIGLAAHREVCCPLHRILGQALSACDQVLEDHKLVELVGQGCLGNSGARVPAPFSAPAPTSSL
jgi:Rrf2 family protein